MYIAHVDVGTSKPHRWLLPEGRQDSRPDGAHPTALPSEFRGRRALLMATRQRKEGPVQGVKRVGAQASVSALTGMRFRPAAGLRSESAVASRSKAAHSTW